MSILNLFLTVSFFSFATLQTNIAPQTTNIQLQTFSTSAEDSTKGKYALNDPRNPDCPCHKYQKLAEDEYKKLTEKPEEVLKNSTDNKKIVTQKKESNVSDKKNSKEKSSLKKLFKKFLRKHKIAGGKHGRERKKKGLLDCFHWH